MAGILIPIIPKPTDFNFSYLGASATQQIPIARAIDAINFDKAVLAVRVHARTMSASQSIKIACITTDPSPADAAEFSLGTDLIVATVSSSAPSSAPGLLITTFTSGGLGQYLKVALTATQGGTGGTALFATLSADLTLRE